MSDLVHSTTIVLDADNERKRTAWPRPGAHAADLAWRLTHGEPTRGDHLEAVRFILAYQSLCLSEQRNPRDTGMVAKRVGRAERQAADNTEGAG